MDSDNTYDPIHEEDGSWYFWDETQADRYGPFTDRNEASRMLDQYASEVLNVKSH